MSDETTMLAAELRALRERLERLERLETPRFVGARYTSNAGQSVPHAAFTIVNFEDVSYDPLGLVTTGTGWAFTCPIAGCYRVSAWILFDGSTAWSSSNVAELDLYRGATAYSVLDRKDNWPGGVSHFAAAGGSDTIECVAGDTLRVQAFQNTGGSLALFPNVRYNYISITRVG